MTPGRTSDAGAWLPARPGTRDSGTAARGSVSGRRPKACRRLAGIGVTPAPSAVLTQVMPTVTPLAGRLLRPALFPFPSAAASLGACAGRRRLLSPGGRRQYSRRDVPDALEAVSAHRALLKSALRHLSAKTRRCASESLPRGRSLVFVTNTVGESRGQNLPAGVSKSVRRV